MIKIRVFSVLTVFFLVALGTFSCSESQQTSDKEASSSKADTEKENQVPKKTILFFGDSMTAGYGVDQDEAFPALLQHKIDSLNLPYKVINGGLSGETSASGLTRIDWFLESKPDIFILELGGNDGLRGIALSSTKDNLQGIIDKVKEKYPSTKIILAGMQIPPNMGEAYTTDFKEIFPSLAEQNDLLLIPFLLDGVGGNPDLNQPDGIHPTAEGHKIVAKTVWKYLEPEL
ncbi:arylesterase [Echinicola vietnamensis]|uniref:Lysophospholipase L1-like esterase n=1 Tax=Echinicola vietnamensis (strain DSM 17526 / LMG 23754 / KMM 6221) TaxID=926556 RepID=L0FYK6_ECHVK|nr:arylesterase [Echinicola vietnamensis]AGA77846.1 lysophospholipase L1-like esterase [Echinicola vietnamensis DSM 17526]